MARIYFIRHGQASLHSDNYDQLSTKGEQQSHVLGQALKQRGIQFDKVYCGAMKRHHQTAEHCLSAMESSLDFQILDGFNEYNHEDVLHTHRPDFAERAVFAQWLASQENPNKAFQFEFQNAMIRWQSGDFDNDYHETWGHFTHRCNDAMHTAQRNNNSEKSIAVFSSGGPISVITGHCLGVNRTTIAELSWAIVNCSITSFVFNRDKTSLNYFNSYSHFEDNNKTLLTYR